MIVVVKVKKIGGSLMARIPSDAVKQLNIREDEEIQLDLKKPKKSYLGAMKGQIGEFTEEDRLESRL
ncbi:MAG TPA: hypothetical protein VJH23_01485 [archaeon]|nr:hypothetical protein [archaeon]